jgi:DNA polymerase (family 10)
MELVMARIPTYHQCVSSSAYIRPYSSRSIETTKRITGGGAIKAHRALTWRKEAFMPSSAAVAAIDRRAVSRALREIGSHLALEGGNAVFRARAYERAARVIENAPDLERVVREGRLTDLPGIGEALAAVIRELCTTGRSERLERLRRQRPSAVVELAALVGQKTAERLHIALGVTGADDLRRACEEHRVREVRGFGPRREAQILEQLRRRLIASADIRLSAALDEGERLCAYLQGLPGVRADLAGAARRGHELVEAVDIVASTDEPELLRERFTSYPAFISAQVETDGVASGRLASGALVRLYVTEPRRHGLALLAHTGSIGHVRRLEELAAERGQLLPARARDEVEIYNTLDLPFVPPELREDEGEIEAAQQGRLPAPLVTAADIQGAVHCHTTASDGRHTLLQMARAAEAAGFRYMTVTDHSPTAQYANGLSVERLRAQWDEIARVQDQVGVRLLRGTECDITADGALDWPDEILAGLDVVIASIHQRYKLDESAMTARVLRAMRHPAFKIWGHPLGRLVPRRPPIPCRLDEILDALAASRGAVEINGDPHRLDMEPRLVRQATARGIPCVVSLDAHAMSELQNLRYGVLMARRAWLQPAQVLNTRSVEDFVRAVRPFD